MRQGRFSSPRARRRALDRMGHSPPEKYAYLGLMRFFLLSRAALPESSSTSAIRYSVDARRVRWRVVRRGPHTHITTMMLEALTDHGGDVDPAALGDVLAVAAVAQVAVEPRGGELDARLRKCNASKRRRGQTLGLPLKDGRATLGCNATPVNHTCANSFTGAAASLLRCWRQNAHGRGCTHHS
jgi:hypothetical protein